MKKILKIVIPIITLIVVVVGEYVFFEKNNFFKKKIISAEEFKDFVYKNGLTNTKEYSNEELEKKMDNLEYGYSLFDSYETYANQASYYIFKDENYAYYYFYEEVISLKGRTSSLAFSKQVQYKNGNFFAIKNEESCEILYQIDNKVVYIKTELEHIDLAEKIFKEL